MSSEATIFAQPVQDPEPEPWGIWATLVITLLLLGLVLFSQILGGTLFLLVTTPAGESLEVSPEVATNGVAITLAGLVSGPVGIFAAVQAARLRRGMSAADYLGLRSFPVGMTIGWMCVLVGYQMVIAMLASVVQPADNKTGEFMVEAFSTASVKPLLWLSVIVLLPLSEELIFRGFMFRGLQHSRLGAAGAIILPALLWGGIHLQYDLFGILAIVGMGIVLGFARLLTGSTWTPIAMHMCWNGLAAVSTELYILNAG